MTRTSNYQDILKTVALLCMIADHTSLYFFPEAYWVRAIGRYAFPIFCFFAGFNFKGNLRFKILLYGLALYIFSVTIIFGRLMETNILISIFIGYIYLKLLRNYIRNFWQAYAHFIFLACCWQLTKHIIEYGTLAIAMMVLGYSVKNNYLQPRIAAFSAAYLSFAHTTVLYYGYFGVADFILAAIVVILLYLSLAYSGFYRTNNYKLNIVSNNLASIYCIHLAIIMLIWRYYTSS